MEKNVLSWPRAPKFSRAGAGALCVAAIATLTAPAHADQFVLFDATFDYTWDDAMNSTPSPSHYYVNEGNWLNADRPGDWVSPINYRDGSAHIRVEVLDKPAGNQRVGWALCYIANVGAYGCPYSDYYTSEGVFETDVDMSSFWKSGPITWESGVKQVDLVYTINDSGSGHVHNFPDLKDATTPTSVRITMVQVSQGDTYDPSMFPDPGGTGGMGSGGSGTGGHTAAGGTTPNNTGGELASGGAETTGDGGATSQPLSDNAGSASDDGGCTIANPAGSRSSGALLALLLTTVFAGIGWRRRRNS